MGHRRSISSAAGSSISPLLKISPLSFARSGHACQPVPTVAHSAGKTVAVEKAEPVYLRNEVAWKKLPGRE
jgi:tRNA A37 threonylcarbamoyladenosine modification protein TsaB